jgi:ribosome biogenesis GTPase / thiamine phosphate phosphatase
MKLELLGWNGFFEAHFAPYREQNLIPGRIAIQHKDRYTLFTKHGEMSGQVSGKFRFDAKGLQDFPSVGDWVAAEVSGNDQSVTIQNVLERKSKLSRKVAGGRLDEQILAANIDITFLVMGLDGDYNLRRMERYLSMSWESGARPVIVLNKSDVCPNLEECTEEVLSIALGVDIIVMNAHQSEQIAPIRSLLTQGTTGVLLGSSGVGKSTITNALLGKEYLEVNEVRENDSRGRHTTARRELLILPNGGIIIDTPGLREIQLWGGDEGIHESFDDIEKLAMNCKFRDCKHEAEPHCAVKNAIENGSLDPGRYENYLKLQKEIQYLALKQEMGAQRLEKERWKEISKLAKKLSSRPR